MQLFSYFIINEFSFEINKDDRKSKDRTIIKIFKIKDGFEIYTHTLKDKGMVYNDKKFVIYEEMKEFIQQECGNSSYLVDEISKKIIYYIV